jgi:hypothetical protein
MILLKQSDPRWANISIGDTNLTLARWGCTITGLSMLSHYFGEFLWPHEIAKKPWFNERGEIIWQIIDLKKFRFVDRVYFEDKKRITEAIRNPKQGCLLQVNLSHWLTGMGNMLVDYTAADPINGKKCWIKHEYGKITGCAIFKLK